MNDIKDDLTSFQDIQPAIKSNSEQNGSNEESRGESNSDDSNPDDKKSDGKDPNENTKSEDNKSSHTSAQFSKTSEQPSSTSTTPSTTGTTASSSCTSVQTASACRAVCPSAITIATGASQSCSTTCYSTFTGCSATGTVSTTTLEDPVSACPLSLGGGAFISPKPEPPGPYFTAWWDYGISCAGPGCSDLMLGSGPTISAVLNLASLTASDATWSSHSLASIAPLPSRPNISFTASYTASSLPSGSGLPASSWFSSSGGLLKPSVPISPLSYQPMQTFMSSSSTQVSTGFASAPTTSTSPSIDFANTCIYLRHTISYVASRYLSWGSFRFNTNIFFFIVYVRSAILYNIFFSFSCGSSWVPNALLYSAVHDQVKSLFIIIYIIIPSVLAIILTLANNPLHLILYLDYESLTLISAVFIFNPASEPA